VRQDGYLRCRIGRAAVIRELLCCCSVRTAPSPRKEAHAVASADWRATETIMLGDREHDVRGARRNHVLQVGALWGYGLREELIAAGAVRLFERPGELVGSSSDYGLHGAAASHDED
jgi:phosphoglycolate phosphatase-like HAD superfamily hydrolase